MSDSLGNFALGVQSDVLSCLMQAYPALLSLEELIRDWAKDPHDRRERNAVEEAVRVLARAGIVHELRTTSGGLFVFVTRPIVRFEELHQP